MNKQEAIDMVKAMGPYSSFQDEPLPKSIILNIINQIDGLQKVVIPKFVAEWIEQNRHKTLFSALGGADWNNSPWIDWVKEIGDTATPQEIFARAWLDGYEVKQEKLYTVEIPNPESGYPTVLSKNTKGEVILGTCYKSKGWRTFKNCQLTESEIKKDFEWAYQWAEPVEEE